MGPLELLGTALGLVSVYLTIRQNIWCWPVGIAMVIVYIFVFTEAKLYSDAGLQVIYIVLQAYGWQHWARGGPRESVLPVTLMPALTRGLWLAAGAISGATLGSVMSIWTDAAAPFADAQIVSFSLVAQWLMARKKLESWLVWIAVDVLAVAVYASKGLYPTAGLYGIFLVLAAIGFIAWRASLRAAGRDQGTVSSLGSSCPRTVDISSSSTSRGDTPAT